MKKNKQNFELPLFIIWVAIIAFILKKYLTIAGIDMTTLRFLLFLIIFSFGAINLKEFIDYRGQGFAKQYRSLWRLFEFSALLIILQSVLLLFGIFYNWSLIIDVICLGGMLIMDVFDQIKKGGFGLSLILVY